jgi:ankyrin repeat protein
MKMKRIPACFLFLIGLTLTACGQATPVPLPTQTAIPLSAEEASQLLLDAAKSDDLAGVTAALEQGADVDTKGPAQEMTPLIIASTRGSTEVATYLIEQGADVNATSEQGMTALIGAALKGSTEIATLLLEKGADVDAANNQGVTPLMGAAQNGHANVVTLLAANGANLDQLSEMQYKENALHLASRNGHTAVVEALLKAGADVDAMEDTHSTALMYAAYNGRLETVQLLIDQGCDVNVRDDGKKTALYWANLQSYEDIAALISAAGGTE